MRMPEGTMDVPARTEPVDIFVTSDNNYALGVMALIASAKLKNDNLKMRAHVGAMGWSDANTSKLADLCASLDVPLNLIEIAPERLSHLKTKRDHVNFSTYIRILVGSLLPQLDRVIYFDCDMICLGGLAELWSTELPEGKILGAVQCPSPMQLAAASIRLSRLDYFNAGLLLVDLRRWRDSGIEAKLVDALNTHGHVYLTEDESALNDVCRGQVEYLPAKFNVYAYNDTDQPIFSTIEDICVLHYILSPKPWTGDCPNDEIWHNLAQKCPGLSPRKPERRIVTRSALRRMKIIAALRERLSTKDRYRRAHAMRRRNLDIVSVHGFFPE